jgi:hypothetical protein
MGKLLRTVVSWHEELHLAMAGVLGVEARLGEGGEDVFFEGGCWWKTVLIAAAPIWPGLLGLVLAGVGWGFWGAAVWQRWLWLGVGWFSLTWLAGCWFDFALIGKALWRRICEGR